MNPARKTFSSCLRKILAVLPVVALFFILTAGTARAQRVVYSGIQDEIPDGANRILLEQREITPAEVYLNALNYFQRADWQVIASEETEDIAGLEAILADGEEPLVFAVENEVAGDLALRIAIHVEPIAAGGRLIASVDYAEDIPTDSWQDATWTNGRARQAFFEALEVLRRTAYDTARFEVGVAVEPEA